MDKKEITPQNARNEAEIFAELEKLCTSPGFIHAIAYFCWRDNLIKFSGDQVTEADVEHQYSHDKLLRTEISTLIGLMAKGKIDLDHPSPATIQHYIDTSEALLYEMHMSLQKPWLSAFQAMVKNQEKAKPINPFDNAEGLREPIFYAGESAYNFQYQELARLKYHADNDWLNAHVGFTIDEAYELVRALGQLQLEKIVRLRKTILKLPPEQWSFVPGFVFSAEELETPTGMAIAKIEQILKAFCFNTEGANSPFSSLSSFNETNAAPIFKISENSFILLQHYSLLEALYEAPYFWMLLDKSYSAAASKHRGEFAEQFLFDRLTHVFGHSNVFRNVDIYKGKNRFAEADVLVLYGDRAIVVQAKSKRLTIEARKGNDLQLKDDFKKAIHDAYDQALLCAQAILGDGYRFTVSSGEEIILPIKPKTILPLCTVSDHYPALSAQARQFLKLTTNNTIHPPMVTDVFFVDVLTEMLDTPLNLLNYLALRSKFDKQLLISQEITTLGYHLKHNLWLEEQYNIVNLGDDFTSALDIAMSARRMGVPGERTPKGILTRFNNTPIGDLLAEIEASKTPELVGLGMLLLQFGSNSATHINNGIEQLVRSAMLGGQVHDMSVPAEAERAGFTIHVSPKPDDEARERLSTHCQVRKYETQSDAWYGILLTPGTGKIKSALVVQSKWKSDAEMDKVLATWPRKSMIPIESLSKRIRKQKTGRNDPCPCGSGIKYKKCCLSGN
ncbi:SEC-C metal-binding domain-containing protein [Agrobacterium sp. 22-223-1]